MDSTGHGRVICSLCGVVIRSCRCLDSDKLTSLKDALTSLKVCDACSAKLAAATCKESLQVAAKAAAEDGRTPEAGVLEVGR